MWYVTCACGYWPPHNFHLGGTEASDIALPRLFSDSAAAVLGGLVDIYTLSGVSLPLFLLIVSTESEALTAGSEEGKVGREPERACLPARLGQCGNCHKCTHAAP